MPCTHCISLINYKLATEHADVKLNIQLHFHNRSAYRWVDGCRHGSVQALAELVFKNVISMQRPKNRLTHVACLTGG